jgi:hypothetical protein
MFINVSSAPFDLQTTKYTKTCGLQRQTQNGVTNINHTHHTLTRIDQHGEHTHSDTRTHRHMDTQTHTQMHKQTYIKYLESAE